MGSRFLIAVAALLFGVSGASAAEPANDNQAMLQALQSLDTRVAAAGHRLAIAALPFCQDQVARPGFTVHGLVQYRPALRADAEAYFGLTSAPAVLAVASGSSAERAGLRVGDTIVRLAGVDMSTAMAPVTAEASFEPVAAVETQIEAALADGALALAVDRDGVLVDMTISGDQGCASRFQIDPSNRLNASADGVYVKISSRLAEFTAGDDELALLLAHELSHNILKHRAQLKERSVRVRATEDEADRLALYLMARAGYDISIAPAFWDRAMRKVGPAILSDGTHAGRRKRVAAAEREIAVIAAQRARGEPPAPEWLDLSVIDQQQSSSQGGIRR